jgi:hypothetical protein
MAKPKQLRDAPNPLAPWFDAAGVDPATFAERYRAAMARYAGWRLAADISAVQTCWGWAVEPPKDAADPSPVELAAMARQMNGGEEPF